jgi:hypothetical protein
MVSLAQRRALCAYMRECQRLEAAESEALRASQELVEVRNAQQEAWREVLRQDLEDGWYMVGELAVVVGSGDYPKPWPATVVRETEEG